MATRQPPAHPPAQHSPADSGPVPLPSVPPGSALWSEADIAAAGPKRNDGKPFARTAAEPMPTIGHIGRYALKYKIGEGGLGTVYAAHDPLLSRLIAIKTLNLEVPAEQRSSFNSLFLNEARAAASLSHPNIVTVFDAGISDNNAYIAMELLKGRDLRQLRQDGWRPTATQAALIVRRVADALAYAHSKGVIHRDVKPANIFMVGRTQPRVLDFGIARVAHHHDAQTGEDLIGGSPYYMAPEQFRHEPGDRRTDVFSLGVVLYELLTDLKPFRGSSLQEITSAVLNDTPVPAQTVNASVPRALSDIAARAMHKDPEQRFRSARALSRELRHWLEEYGQNENAEPAPAPEQRRSRNVWVGAALATVVGAGVAWSLLSMADKADPAVPAVAAIAPAPAAVVLPAPTPAPAVVAKAPVIVNSPPTQFSTAPAIGAVVPQTPPAAPQAADNGTSNLVITSTPPLQPRAAASKPEAALVLIGPNAPSARNPPPQPAAAVKKAPNAASTRAASNRSSRDISDDPNAQALAHALAERYVPRSRANPAPLMDPDADDIDVRPQQRRRGTRDNLARDDDTRDARTSNTTTTGVVRLAVSPWGDIEVDGAPAGTVPPLTELTLTEGRHRITIRNGDFQPHVTTITVVPGQPVMLRHKFGS